MLYVVLIHGLPFDDSRLLTSFFSKDSSKLINFSFSVESTKDGLLIYKHCYIPLREEKS